MFAITIKIGIFNLIWDGTRLWLDHDGEGMEITPAELERLLDEFMSENF